MRRLLCASLIALVVAACGDDDSTAARGDQPATSAEAVDGGDSVESGGSVDNDGSGGSVENDGGGAPGGDPTTTIPTDDPATGAPDDRGSEGEGRDEGIVLVSDLTAGAAVPPPGDEDAAGRVEVQSPDEGTLCFDMVASGLSSEVTAAHVHRGEAGVSGEVVVGIGTPTASDGATDAWQDVCVDVDPALLDQIEAEPGAYYTNVHTSSHPESALRGQLEAASIFDLTLS